ncbi:MAG: NAD(P)H:quinone oxidoreductase [Gammaproteobacteria bacterium]
MTVPVSRVAVVVDSRYGSTLELALAITAGAEAEGAAVRLRRVGLSEPEFSVEPQRESYGNTRQQLEALSAAGMVDLRWADGLVFGSPTRYGLHGMVIVGVPHSVPALVRTRKGGSPYGASAVTGFDGLDGVNDDERAIARALGARVARLAGQVRAEPSPVEFPSDARE